MREHACVRACVHAFAFKGKSAGRCVLYGKGLDERLVQYAEPPSEKEWEGDTQLNFLVAAANGEDTAKCFAKGTSWPPNPV